jgi:acyl-coenzyme A thioesterase PaaI-like protein
MPTTLELYERCKRFPLGKHAFSRAVTLRAPFFAKIRPRIIDLHRGGCTIRIQDRWSIRNHIGSVNAGALCTLCELTAGMAVDASIPQNLRWIPTEMTVQYLKKARGTLLGVSSFDPAILMAGDVRIPVEIRNGADEPVLRGVILFYLSERKPKSS